MKIVQQTMFDWPHVERLVEGFNEMVLSKIMRPPTAFNCHGRFIGKNIKKIKLVKQLPVAFIFLFHGLS